MKKQDLTNDEQMVLSYLVLIDAYVKRNNTSDDEEENSLYDQFTQVFDGMGENSDGEQQHLFYDNLISLNNKKYIVFEDSSYKLDDDMQYEFDSLKISEKGEEYARKYMELDKEKLKIAMKKVSALRLPSILDLCKQINNNELFKLFATFVSAITAILGIVIK